jgi:hypothetical protein
MICTLCFLGKKDLQVRISPVAHCGDLLLGQNYLIVCVGKTVTDGLKIS